MQTIINSPPGMSQLVALPYNLRDELDRARKGEGHSPASQGDPGSARAPRRGDWEKIIRVAQDWMTHQAKDIGIAARMAEALTKLHGAAGLRDGLTLLRRFAEECWEELAPGVGGEQGDEGRIAPLHWLDDPNRGALFPGTVRLIALFGDEAKRYSWVDWRKIHARPDDSSWKEFERASRGIPFADCMANLENMIEAGAELDRLVAAVVARSGRADFDMPALRGAIRDCEELARMVASHHPDHAATLAHDEVSATFDEIHAARIAGPLEYRPDTPTYSREQIYDMVGQLADMLGEAEPHSPVPYMLRRAVELGSMPFPRLMRELVREPGPLGRVFQELGISEVS